MKDDSPLLMPIIPRSEWWYFSGRLNDGTGAEYDYFLCFFRSKLFIELTRFAHFAFWGPGSLIFESRDMRPRKKSAGLGQEKIDMNSGGWAATSEGERILLTAEGSLWRIRLSLQGTLARSSGIRGRIELPGVKTRCVSLPRLATEGEITRDGKNSQVTGASWFDHEWGSIALPHRWDWWGINLEDGTDLAIRLAGGKGLAHRRTPSGICQSTRRVVASAQKHWKTAEGASYPVEWKIELPDFGTELLVRPNRDDCENPFHVRYWEGPCHIEARVNDKNIKGRGYMELVGYHTQFPRFLLSRARMVLKNLFHG